MDTPEGLLVPNIKSVEQLSVIQIAQELKRLQELGANGKLGPSDLKDGTITLSNIGSVSYTEFIGHCFTCNQSVVFLYYTLFQSLFLFRICPLTG